MKSSSKIKIKSQPPLVTVDDSQNPLLNNLVLERLFQIIPFNYNDYKNYRLVSKLWFKESLSRWRKDVCLTLSNGGAPSGNEHNNMLFINPFMEMLDLANDPYDLTGKNHFRKYKVQIIVELNESKKFWDKVGPLITHLKLSHCNLFLSIDEFARVLFEKTPNLTFLSLERNNYQTESRLIRSEPIVYPFTPDQTRGRLIPRWRNELRPSSPSEVQGNLTHFEITFGRGFESGSQGFGISWMYFFLRYPNIKTLKLQHLPNEFGQDAELLKLLTSLKTVREHGAFDCLSNLQHLDLLNLALLLTSRLPRYILGMLRQLNFPLTSLSLDVGVASTFWDLRNVLELYSNTLQKLTVFRGPFKDPFPETFPYGVCLPYLTHLKIIGAICTNLHFLKNVPNLQSLILLETLSEKGWPLVWVPNGCRFRQIEKTQFSSETMKNLICSHLHEFIVEYELCSGENVKAPANLMPNLKKLRLGFDNEGFKVVCKRWKQLRHLEIEPFNVEEEGILGIENGEKYCVPSITELSYLNTFETGIHYQDSKKGWMTNDSIVDGLFVLQTLRNVSFTVAPKVNKEVMNMIAFKFPGYQADPMATFVE